MIEPEKISDDEIPILDEKYKHTSCKFVFLLFFIELPLYMQLLFSKYKFVSFREFIFTVFLEEEK